MRADLFAILTGLCWAIGSYFEKKGVKLGGFSPIMGPAIRTAASLVVLSLLSYPLWGQLKTAGVKPIIMIAIGGGVFAGALGLIFFYTALKGGNISIVLPIAFCSVPVFGAIIGVVAMGERLLPIQMAGIALTILGAALTAYFRA